MKSISKLVAAAFSVSLCLAGAASAQSWDATHPRRDQVNDRLQTQSDRIHQERVEGDISGRQAYRLHRQDRRIRHEERRMARHDGGHITTAEQRRLNHQENRVSGRIGQ